MSISEYICRERSQQSTIRREGLAEEFHSDRSRIVFASSFRRMIRKAQVFSLESNTSIRNRLTHTLEVADIGRTLARAVGGRLMETGRATQVDAECIQTIVENACLLHDIGNPPFGHFGEAAIQSWFKPGGSENVSTRRITLPKEFDCTDFLGFDGNPQGFRIATRLHTERDRYSLNLTYSTLLATVKYPFGSPQGSEVKFGKKIGVFSGECDIYQQARDACGVKIGKRYFLVYLMELADDLCYCLSDIADSLEKGVISRNDYRYGMQSVCDSVGDGCASLLIPEGDDWSFSHMVAIKVSRRISGEASKLFSENLDSYIAGEADELSESVSSAGLLRCLKMFARKYIYRSSAAERMEIAGSKIVTGLLDHYGMLLRMSPDDFVYFVEERDLPKKKGKSLDLEWRVFNQLSPRMIKAYKYRIESGGCDELTERARLIVDFIAGMTDDSARDYYQNFMGISI